MKTLIIILIFSITINVIFIWNKYRRNFKNKIKGKCDYEDYCDYKYNNKCTFNDSCTYQK